ncbi:MAG: hypothetical protein MAG795_00821 [Candidatus Woesearchaeota archaeon]|nr:hypothetical protein [Candidatus Woesearchaeota archaeon]
MYIPKKYGKSKINKCPFCEKQATIKNKQVVPVCPAHKDKLLENTKCACGEWLDVCAGKWGPYFRCMDCGNINFRKGLELNPHIRNSDKNQKQNQKEQKTKKDSENQISAKPNYKAEKETKKSVTIRSDELDFYFN